MSDYGWGAAFDREELYAELAAAGLVTTGRKYGEWHLTERGRRAFTLLSALVHDEDDSGPIW